VSSPKEICWGPTIYCSKKNKRKLKEKINTLQEKHIAYKVIKNSVLKDDQIFLLMKKRVPWASPSFDACTSWIFLGGVMGIPKFELLSILYLISSFSFPYT
jgi:hypothetical protein